MPKPGKKKANDDPLLKIQDAIRRKMHRKHAADMFVCKDDLDLIWPDYSLHQLFPSYKPEERETIRKDYLCVLSILIYVGWTDLTLFRPLFLRENGRDDASLPFTDIVDLAFLGTLRQVFSFHQHAFKPVVIEEHNARFIQKISTEHRLPFICEPELLGSGGYGSVTKRVIAPRCLFNKDDNKVNLEVCIRILRARWDWCSFSISY